MLLQIRQQHRQLLHEHHQRFHAVWGQLLKTGYQNSRFAHQVERFACLYTSHVSNLAFYSPDKSYRCAGVLQLVGHPQLTCLHIEGDCILLGIINTDMFAY